MAILISASIFTFFCADFRATCRAKFSWRFFGIFHRVAIRSKKRIEKKCFFTGELLAANLREFGSANEHHPESVRVFPWLRPAGHVPDPVDPPDPANEFHTKSFLLANICRDPPKIQSSAVKLLNGKMFWSQKLFVTFAGQVWRIERQVGLLVNFLSVFQFRYN